MKNKNSFKITNSILRQTYSKLIYSTLCKQLFIINRNLGCYWEPSDYAQNVLICITKKINDDKVNFETFSKFWSYCNRVLDMLLMRQHRDLTLISSRKATLIDIDGKFDSGKNIDDVAGFQSFFQEKSQEDRINYEFCKNYILSINNCNISIIPITKLFLSSKDSLLINLYTFLEEINSTSINKTFNHFNINKKLKNKIIISILDFFKINKKSFSDTHLHSISSLGSRDRLIYNELKERTKNLKKIPLELMLK